MTKPLQKHQGYHAGHPWYYYLGGDIPTLKQIRMEAIASDYRGYKADDIVEIDQSAEPRRSEKLRLLQQKFKLDLGLDISRYREVVRELRKEREQNPPREPFTRCNDVHTAMSLKHSHLFNDFAHLDYLDELLGRQMDLFDL